MLESASDIYIEFDRNSNTSDKYDRLLGNVFVDNNNLSELLLSKGLAEVKCTKLNVVITYFTNLKYT